MPVTILNSLELDNINLINVSEEEASAPIDLTSSFVNGGSSTQFTARLLQSQVDSQAFGIALARGSSTVFFIRDNSSPSTLSRLQDPSPGPVPVSGSNGNILPFNDGSFGIFFENVSSNEFRYFRFLSNGAFQNRAVSLSGAFPSSASLLGNPIGVSIAPDDSIIVFTADLVAGNITLTARKYPKTASGSSVSPILTQSKIVGPWAANANQTNLSVFTRPIIGSSNLTFVLSLTASTPGLDKFFAISFSLVSGMTFSTNVDTFFTSNPQPSRVITAIPDVQFGDGLLMIHRNALTNNLVLRIFQADLFGGAFDAFGGSSTFLPPDSGIFPALNIPYNSINSNVIVPIDSCLYTGGEHVVTNNVTPTFYRTRYIPLTLANTSSEFTDFADICTSNISGFTNVSPNAAGSRTSLYTIAYNGDITGHASSASLVNILNPVWQVNKRYNGSVFTVLTQDKQYEGSAVTVTVKEKTYQGSTIALTTGNLSYTGSVLTHVAGNITYKGSVAARKTSEKTYNGSVAASIPGIKTYNGSVSVSGFGDKRYSGSVISQLTTNKLYSGSVISFTPKEKSYTGSLAASGVIGKTYKGSVVSFARSEKMYSGSVITARNVEHLYKGSVSTIYGQSISYSGSVISLGTVDKTYKGSVKLYTPSFAYVMNPGMNFFTPSRPGLYPSDFIKENTDALFYVDPGTGKVKHILGFEILIDPTPNNPKNRLLQGGIGYVLVISSLKPPDVRIVPFKESPGITTNFAVENPGFISSPWI